MFSKNKAPASATAPTAQGKTAASPPVQARAGRGGGGVPSIVSPDLTITGDLQSTGDIQVDGKVKGDVSADTLTIGEQGRVDGKVRGERVRICGTVEGEIEGGTVTLAASARVMGDIVHDSLAIEPGAHLEGHCRRRAPAQNAETAGRVTGAAKTGKGDEAGKASDQPAASADQSGDAKKAAARSNGSAVSAG